MKIAVIGAGAMGCLYGGYLSQNNEVIMLDSYEPQVRSINEHGITIVEADGQELVCSSVRAYLSGDFHEAVDLVIVFVKSTFTEGALSANAHLFGEHTAVMTLQNGAGNDRKISQYVSKEQIIVGTSKHNAMNLGEGRTKHTGIGATTIGSNCQNDKLVSKIAETLRSGGLQVVESDDIQRIIWSKLFVNLSVNTFTALLQTPIGYMLKNKYAWDFAKRLVYEAVEVAEADGTYFDRREALDIVRQVCIDAGDGYSSMYQDRKRHVKTEIDAINGAIVEQAKQYGIPTPYNSLIVDLIHAVEGAYEYDV